MRTQHFVLEQGHSARLEGENGSYLVAEAYDSGIDSITWPTTQDAAAMLVAAEEILEYEDPQVDIILADSEHISITGITRCLEQWSEITGRVLTVTISDEAVDYDVIWQTGLGEGDPDEIGIVGTFPAYLDAAQLLIPRVSPHLTEDLK